MNRLAEIACKVSLCAALACFSALTWAQGVSNSIENLQVSQQGGNTIVKLQLKQPLAAPPGSFSIANPARLAFDFPATENGLGRNSQVINQGELRSLNVVQVGDRTRLVLNLRNMVPFETRVDGEALYITFAAQAAASTAATTLPAANFAQPAARDMRPCAISISGAAKTARRESPSICRTLMSVSTSVSKVPTWSSIL